MNIEKTLAVFAAGISRAEKGIEVAGIKGNSQLLALNVRQYFKNQLASSLVLWRAERDPTCELKSAVEVIFSGGTGLNASGCDVPIEKAVLIAKLIGSNDRLLSRNAIDLSDEAMLDMELALTERGVPTSDLVNQTLTKLGSQKRTQLVSESYRTYFDIVSEKTKDRLPDLIKKAENLYEKRVGDEYFSGGERSEGGGEDNELMVDYRLAVALLKAGYATTSIHSWKWGSE